MCVLFRRYLGMRARRNPLRHFEIDVNVWLRCSACSSCRATTAKRPDGKVCVVRLEVQIVRVASMT